MAAEKEDREDSAMLKLIAASKENPGFNSKLMKAVDENASLKEALQKSLLKLMLKTVLKVIKTAFRGATQEEIIEAAEPFVGSEEDRQALANIAVLGNLHKSLEILMGENYYKQMT